MFFGQQLTQVEYMDDQVSGNILKTPMNASHDRFNTTNSIYLMSALQAKTKADYFKEY